MKLIDVEALKEDIALALINGCRDETTSTPVTVRIAQIINEAPEVNAIPIKWLLEQLDITAEENSNLNWCIFQTLYAWEKNGGSVKA